MFRGLRADEIEVRVGTITKKGASLLLYKDARCDMNILDEVYGIGGWQREHRVVNDNLYCGIGIWNNEINQWVWKWDCGTESFTEKEKGEASDSFKRAAFNIGIGRELYTSGFIFVPCETESIPSTNKFKLKNPYEFSGAFVSEVTYKETANKREINRLIIKDNKGKEIFAKVGTNIESGEVTEKELQKLFATAEKAGYNKDLIFKQIESKYNKTPDILNQMEYKQMLIGYEKLVKEKNKNK